MDGKYVFGWEGACIVDEGRNVFGVSKKTIAERLYYKLVDETGFESDIVDFTDFKQCFIEALEDYALIPKTGVID